MTAFKSDFLNVLQSRGFIHQVSEPEALDALAQKGDAGPLLPWPPDNALTGKKPAPQPPSAPPAPVEPQPGRRPQDDRAERILLLLRAITDPG